MVFLMEGERILLQDAADSEFGKGTLILTNKRLLFERQKGFLSKKSEVLVDLQSSAFLGVQVDSFGQLLMEAEVVHLSPVILKEYSTGRITFKVENPEKWVTEFESTR